jgi:hypothetical protein
LVLAAAPSSALASGVPQPFSAPRDPDSFDRALQCLTQAIYYEARGEAEEGQRAVAQVVLNRVRHPSYPNSVCGVVYQGSQRQTGCQFTFTCDGSMGAYIDGDAWARAQQVARAALRGSVYRPVGLALNYHTTAILPYWAPSLVRQTVVGSHIFYRKPGSGSIEAFHQEPADSEPERGYASAPQAGRARSTRPSREAQHPPLQLARVERPRVERPTIQRETLQRVTYERPQVERPPGFGPPVSSRTASPSRASAATLRPQPQVRPAAVRTGPRTTIEGGVRVSRGS